jgi:site-specific DNA-cytosine methylase
VKRRRPAIAFFENIVALAETPKQNRRELSPCEAVQEEMERILYEILPIKLNAKHFALPHDRRRLHFVSLDTLSPLFKIGCASAVFSMVTELLRTMKVPSPDLPNVMLSHSHPLVVRALTHAEEAVVKERDPKSTGWPQRHEAFMKAKSLRSTSLTLHESLAGSRWLRAMSKRQQECLAFIQKEYGAAASGDLSQNIERLRVHPSCVSEEVPEVAPVLLCATEYFVGRERRFLTGPDVLNLQAIKWQHLAHDDMMKFSDADLRSIGGNAYAGTVALSLLMSVCASLDWQDDPDKATTPETTDAALGAAFACLRDLQGMD